MTARNLEHFNLELHFYVLRVLLNLGLFPISMRTSTWSLWPLPPLHAVWKSWNVFQWPLQVGRENIYLWLKMLINASFFTARPIELAYDSWSFVKGTSGKRYVIDSMFFANSSVNHNNWCFENGAQLPSGLYNASSCRFGAPIFMSQPHFYQVLIFFPT